MSQPDMLVAIVGLLGALILVTNGSRFRSMEHGQRIKLGLIWLLIFVVLALLAQAAGLHTPA